MCGRYSLAANHHQLAEAFTGFTLPVELTPRYNIAPTQPVAVVANNGQGKVDLFNWGLIPGWAKDPAIGSRMINARAETLAEKPAFKTAYRRRRCLVLADGFYEWQTSTLGEKTPMYIRLVSGLPFAFAGLWETWRDANGSAILSCAIITTTPNDLLASIHNRMPVILPPQAYADWLDPAERTPTDLNPLLQPYPATLMTAYPVSKTVNNPKNDTPDCMIPITSLT